MRTTTCASVPAQSGDATSAIQTALNGCSGKNQVVALAAGTYHVSSTITIPSGVVLRGAGSDASTGTTILSTKGGPVLSIGTMQDTVCYDSSGFDSSAKPLLTQDAAKETSTLVVADASKFSPGDLAMVDQVDDAQIDDADCTYFKRLPNYAVSERVEVSAVSNNTITLTTPLHWTFKTGQKALISKVSSAAIKWAGIESVLLQGGRPGGYDGQNAGGIDVANAAYCWVKEVQVDGTTSGMPIRLGGTYRCVVRDSHIHNSYSYGFGQDNYGIVMSCGSADNLVENNISRFLNKPFVFNNSGGGNVVAYNYADNSWAGDTQCDDGWQEVNIDNHCSFPHMELIEGNWAPHMGATGHGNAGYWTFFRNYSSSQSSPSKAGQESPVIWGNPFTPQYGNIESLEFLNTAVNMTVIGNVFGSTTDTSLGLPADLGTTATAQGAPPATSKLYFSDGSGPSIFNIDKTAVAWTSLWLHGNFDTVNRKVMWNASPLTANLASSTQSLPASLYRATRPEWWPTGTPWPWAGPDLTPRVSSLPAHDRSTAFNYYTAANANCTLHCSTYCCSVGASCSL